MKRKMEAPNQLLWGRMKGDFFSCGQGEADEENGNVLSHSSMPTH